MIMMTVMMMMIMMVMVIMLFSFKNISSYSHHVTVVLGAWCRWWLASCKDSDDHDNNDDDSDNDGDSDDNDVDDMIKFGDFKNIRAYTQQNTLVGGAL